MQIAMNTVVSITYELSDVDGNILESTSEPVTYLHGGYDNTAALQDPNRVVPIDALRELEREGQIGQLLDTLYVTVGNIGALNAMKRMGAEIAADLQQRGVGAVIVPAT